MGMYKDHLRCQKTMNMTPIISRQTERDHGKSNPNLECTGFIRLGGDNQELIPTDMGIS